MTAHHDTSPFGALLRSWRQTRRLSQLDLALACGASQRHMSFLESGRARPSRGMALTLGSVLRVPLKDQNLMLLAAGHAPAFAERARKKTPDAKPIDASLIEVIRRQDPMPAMLLDGGTRIAAANEGAERLFAFLMDRPRDSDDLAALFFGPGGVGRYLENAEEVMAWSERQQRAQRILNLAPGETMIAAPAAARREPVTPDGPALTLRLAKDGVKLGLYTLLATLGTPLDFGAERLSLEFFLPADQATEDWFRTNAR
ncbi:MAG: helix-turn-helix domain-containing protein [Micropepsaceae bacterium]